MMTFVLLDRALLLERRETVLVSRLLAEVLAGGLKRRTFMRGKPPR
ncbi:MAG: hypothetical protein IJI73_10290 [Kiritimatiellae bacterium]|nr:hypothetical protein [Kiritimatiellia bacterium]